MSPKYGLEHFLAVTELLVKILICINIMRLPTNKDSTLLLNPNNYGNNIITITIIVEVLQFRGSPATNCGGWYFTYVITTSFSADISH